MTLIEADATVLFQGDSITDAGRIVEQTANLGSGYAMIAAARFQTLHPRLRVRFLNRGVSGNRAVDLRRRWQRDCLDLAPTWVSIMIGINDTWRRYDQHQSTSPAEFAEHYRTILEQTRASGARIIMLEPFLLAVPDDRRQWREDLDPKIQIVRELAREYAAAFVPLDGLFAQASVQREPAFWAGDGVHPSSAGHALIAEAWLRAVDA